MGQRSRIEHRNVARRASRWVAMLAVCAVALTACAPALDDEADVARQSAAAPVAAAGPASTPTVTPTAAPEPTTASTVAAAPAAEPTPTATAAPIATPASTATRAATPEPTATAAPTATPERTATSMPAATPEPTPPPPDPEVGRQLAQANACTACHTITGGVGVGPTWQGLFGREQTLSDGTTVVVGYTYLRESIINTDAKVVEGFAPGVMPQDFAQRLSEEQIASIIAYIKTL